MAMNKKEQAELDAARHEVRLARALSWPCFPKPKTINTQDGNRPIVGWTFNVHTCSVYRGAQVGCGGTFGEISEEDAARLAAMRTIYDERPSRLSLSQHAPQLYATREDAAKAMLHELTRECAEKLAATCRLAFPEEE